MIPAKIAAAFSSAVRARGDEYFRSRRVRIVRAGSSILVAVVKGTTAYAVELEAEPGLLSASCTCPYSADNGICKHIWAALRQADAELKLDTIIHTTGKNPELFAEAADRDLAIDDDFGEAIVDLFGSERPLAPRSRNRPTKQPSKRQSEWKSAFDVARRQMAHLPPTRTAESQATWPADRRMVYIVDLIAAWNTAGIVIELATEKLNAGGTWDPPVAFRMAPQVWHSVPDPLDRQIAQMLVGAPGPNVYIGQPRTSGFVLRDAALETTLRLMCETGRCRVRREAGERPTTSVEWDDGPPWEIRLRIVRESEGSCFVDAVLRRPGEEMPITEPTMLHSAGLLLARGAFARFDHRDAFSFVQIFREKRSLQIPESEVPELLETLYLMPRRPDIELPPDAHVSELRDPPRFGVSIHPDPSPWRKTHHRLELFFIYGPHRLTGAEAGPSLFDRRSLTVRHRDLTLETAAREHLAALGARDEWQYGGQGRALTIHTNKLSHLILDLVAAGWHVEADGAVYRAAGETRASVRSGIDWFELEAGVRYGDIEVSLHELLSARKLGETTIQLSDGSRGVIPLDWLARLGPLTAGGKLADGAVRYTRSQTGLLDALLATLPEAHVDETFERARAELRTFDEVAPADPPGGFCGSLRQYQREGLGWLHFLRRFGLGGCLADDMGLGKTVQVLALLEARRCAPDRSGRPSLVVVPRSLVFNWMREAGRFTPKLRMLDYTGIGRRTEAIDGASVDVVVTTYGTLRRDVVKLAAIDFDYAILDEAQAIKTATSASAKAARLLRADHRLAMTGTPIENRLDELWSLFEFLNPGMLGAASKFSALTKLGVKDDAPPAGRDILSRALKPVILRRTKEQVARDLPARVEQTLSVELEGAQRKFYDDLLEAYRRSVLERVDRVGVGKARMHILEALLRLRQAACHPALADPRKVAAPSAKLDALIPALEEVVAEGHKALVFSQFTSFLSLLRARLDDSGARYEYLDGRVRDRQARVDRFESDPTCPLFLISLKAGGHGLNLTSADYVFILDPWWNPAVEAQAIDRAHRIGQTRQVIATRIVARDTIEEKILELQASKRALADAILGEDQGVLSQIGREELEALLR